MTMTTRLGLLTATIVLLGGNFHGVSASGSQKTEGKDTFSDQLQTIPFFVKIAEDETVELLSHGPFTVSASCSYTYDQAAVMVTVVAEEEDEWVFGFPDYERREDDGLCIGYHPAGTSDSCVMFAAGSGIDDYPHAFQSLSGYYLGLGGHTIAFSIDYFDYDGTLIYHQYSREDIAQFPSEYKCMISGALETFVHE